MPTDCAKELNRTRIHHFHAYNRVRLTIYTLPFENPESQCTPKEIVYGVGMALCHKGDSGNRREGLELAKMSSQLVKDSAHRPNTEQSYKVGNHWLMVDPGMFVFKSPEALKNLILHLRAYERCYGNSRCFSEYNRVFRGNFKHVMKGTL